MNYTKEFGKYIRACRKKAGISQETFAEKCDLSTRQISNIETGRCEPKLSTIFKMCEACNISFDGFMKELTLLFRPDIL